MPVLAVVPDLYFATRIAATAQAAGVDLELVPAPRAAARAAEAGASLVLLDLHGAGALELIDELKHRGSNVPVVGFCLHVDTTLQRDALAAGADAVLPRSQFVGRLAALLQHGVGALTVPREDLPP